MDLIYSDSNGKELGFLKNGYSLDLDIGKTNDFEITCKSEEKIMDFDYRIYINHTEYGGVIRGIRVDTGLNKLSYYGQTWRGILDNYVIAPGNGEDYVTVSGNTSDIIRTLIRGFGLSTVYSVGDCDGIITRYQFDRYCTLLSGITKMLNSVGYRLSISCISGEVTLTPAKIADYSETIEYSRDGNVDFKIDDNRNGINHLICLGKGELKERQVINLYLQSDGTIDKTQYYEGLEEHAAVYDYSAVESLDELEKSGRERFVEMLSNQTLEMSVDEINVELGDKVGGRERLTGISIVRPITQKIVKISNGKLQISYTVG